MDRQKIKNTIYRQINIPNVTAFSFLVLLLITAGRYGFFGDELYYIACSKHLAFGTVDHPPFVDFMTFLSIKLFGETLFGLRLLAGLTGAVTVLISARIARELGGDRFSQGLTALCVFCSFVFLAICSFFSMNCFDLLFCSLAIFVFIRILKNPVPRNWIIFGVILGLGLLNKYTFLVLGFALLISLVFTRQWQLFKSPWLYISGLIGLLMFLPHIFWQIKHSWPTLEFMHNATAYKNLSLTVVGFLVQLIVGLNPLSFPIWFSGLLCLLISKKLKSYRVLGWTILLFLLIYMIRNSKFYYVIPVFPLLMASGAIAVEWFVQRVKANWFKWVIVSLLILSGFMMMPLSIPVLPVEKFIAYSKSLGIRDQLRMEKDENENLPLHFVYRFGWEELVTQAAEIYHELTEEEKANCAILASWYGPAGAVDHFGPKHDLPNAICAHNNYWIWGFRDYTGETLVTIDFSTEHLIQMYEEVKIAATFEHPYAKNMMICICRKPKYTLQEVWPHLKHFM